MKIVDVLGNLRIPISEEENILTNKIKTEGKLYRRSLEIREAELARQLVTRGVLNRHKDNDGMYYTYNALENIWRD